VNIFSNKTKLKIYEWSYSHNKKVWVVGWLALSGILLYVAARRLPWTRVRLLHHPAAWAALFYLLCLVALLAMMHLLTYSGWFGIRFRYAALWITRLSGAFGRWLFTGWRIPLILLAAITGLRSLHWSLTTGHMQPVAGLLGLDSIVRTGIWAALVAMAVWSYRVRKRIVILPFNNLTGDDTLKATAESVAPRLMNELCRLTELYALTDEARPKQSGDQARGPTLNIEDVGNALQGVVTADSKIKLGTSVEIPIGALIASIGRIVQGPRLSGSLQKEANGWVLIARIAGGGLAGDWRVESSNPGDEPSGNSDATKAVIEELAYRVFTMVVRVGSPRWRAVRSYSEGLRIYRDQLRSQRDRLLKLRQAEKEFIQALAEDNEFARNYYNLGIVYRALKQPDSARVCFRKAIEYDPHLSSAYYAMALDSWQEQGNCEDALRYCEQGIFLRPEDAQSWDLKGVLLGILSIANGVTAQEKLLQSVASHEVAVALAWRALCWIVGLSEQNEAGQQTAVDCLTDLGDARENTPALHRSSIPAYNQALYLEPTQAYAHFKIGRSLEQQKRNEEAAESYRRALHTVERPAGWAYLAATQAKLFAATDDERYREACLTACRNAIDPPSEAVQETVQIVEDAYLTAGLSPLDHRPDLVLPTLALIEKNKSIPRSYRRWIWARAFTYIRQGNRNLQRNRPRIAAECFKKAIEALQKSYPKELQTLALFASLADAYLLDKRLEQALGAARQAVELSPDIPQVRHVLARVYFEIGDYDNAEREWQTCLSLDPNNPELLQWIASAYLERAFNCHEPTARRLALSQVIALLSQTLDTVFGTKDIGSLHFWLGRFHRELLQYDLAIQHLVTARLMRWKPIETKINLGAVYIQAKVYRKAEETFAEAAAELRNRLRSAKTDGEDTAPDTMSKDELLARIYLGWAESYAERGANLERARVLARHASWPISQLTEKGTHDALQAYQHYCLGLIYLQNDDAEAAIEELRKSDAIEGVCCSYFRLSQGYLACARTSPDAADKALAKARQHMTDARKADLRGEYENDLDLLSKEIDALEATAKSGAAVVQAVQAAAASPAGTPTAPQTAAKHSAAAAKPSTKPGGTAAKAAAAAPMQNARKPTP